MFTTLNSLSFGKRIIVGNQKQEVQPFNDYFYSYVQGSLQKPKITLEGIQTLNANIIRHILDSQTNSSPLDPSLDDNSNNSVIPKPENCISSEELYNKHKLLLGDEEAKWKTAGENFGKKYASEISVITNKSITLNKENLINEIISTNDFLSDGMEVEINTEDAQFRNLVHSDEATIFLINHDLPPNDITLTYAFISELYKAYKANGKTHSCPLPKLVLNETLIKNLPQKFNEKFRQLEAVGVNALPYPTKERASFNENAMTPILNEFEENKSHIFIFPEGRRSYYRKELSFSERFQYGVSKVIQNALKTKKRVKVVSLGVSYDNGIGSVYTGKPLYFGKNGDYIVLNKGNFAQDTKITQSNSFYKKLAELDDSESFILCEKGKAISDKTEELKKLQSRLISGVLVRDMEICSQKAKNQNQ